MTTETMNLVRIPVTELHFDPKTCDFHVSIDGSDDQEVLVGCFKTAA